ncbi:MAG: hypothetical protein A2667_01450 [Candidatus Wildermuthbacteria bacterium RIFCSPHIGHO2_01_FULL_47_27]|uniref:Type II secretion system protein GspF domain-containing protein n=2 Tax=Candidatus Wildermuthiibacteriota TaxID=1817923 RepID=A0A1G2RT39_9BACT|nr:MAG: Type II secretion system F domain protein [Parcubacteria group bacterium GW2011_GWA2_47_9]OHA64256.1 MAG: hypothetical protein A2667_01450 [Candidatus Wildermuthbacteria bacterium RIFCSPHIGHO2_01_FULL_47_27]OHA67610.1 MAG: hypothetical protein A3D59_03520 [Candidatus Wildermuthbacteria bacterium RIFCSPHIGHO2_02_FULL_47_17]OHA75216.1 MAG: hypothetical protein A3I38_01555 [Candidatus Wildermuthbacteria bacterium RIFCSPLOWO2_02_FULL_47_10]OHA75452.1 MAG: hypothetical protein A3A32_02430 [C
MAQFTYKCITKDGKIAEGTISAASQWAGKRKLRKKGSSVLYLTSQKQFSFLNKISFFGGLSATERINFFRNLASMLESGLAPTTALSVFEEQTKSYHHKKMFAVMRRNIENGKTLSDAMIRFPRHFSEYSIAIMRVGETTGTLVHALDRISLDLETGQELRRQVITAVAYPVVVVTVMIAVAMVLISQVLPKIAELFAEMEANLPFATRALLASGAFLAANALYIAVVVPLFLLIVLGLVRTNHGKYFFHYVMLKFPLFGNLIQEYNLAQFFRSLDSLFSSGASLIEAVEISGKTLNNELYRRALQKSRAILLHGVPLSDILRAHPALFPLHTQRIIEVAERTGTFQATFGRVSSHYERSVRHSAQLLTALLEPILMLVVGIAVGGLALTIFLPLYQIASVLK